MSRKISIHGESCLNATKLNEKIKPYQSIWFSDDLKSLIAVDQRFLPHQIKTVPLSSVEDVRLAIKDMVVRGAPLIGITAAAGLYLACISSAPSSASDIKLKEAAERIKSARPTAVDLFKITDQMLMAILQEKNLSERGNTAFRVLQEMIRKSRNDCNEIGKNGLKLIQEIFRKKGKTVNILTHCNAGQFATLGIGTATAPIYLAHQQKIPLHVWVDETRPRNQGANLTMLELQQQGVDCTLICDNTGGCLMQKGLVDIVFVGADRISVQGDAANKIGTYLKALSAWDNKIPFYVAAPSSSIDFSIKDGLKEIPIEERNPNEVKYIRGWNGKAYQDLLICPKNSKALNIGFDVTPARLITGIITERGICKASEEGLRKMYPEIMPI